MSEKSKKRILLEKVLRNMSRVILWKYNPRIVGVTGSVGKTSTKEAIFSVLSKKFRVRKNEKNYNNEIGLPLTIIGIEGGEDSFWGWFRVVIWWMLIIIFPKKYPEILILEMGADRPGDVKYLSDFIHPKIGVITEIAESHLEYFETLEGVAKEKGILIRDLGEEGLAVLNADNEFSLKLKNQTKARVITFGFSEAAEMRAENVGFNYDKKGSILGLSFKLNFEGTSLPVRLNNILAKHQIYAALAAATVATELGMNLVEIAQGLENFSSPAGRMILLPGIHDSLIIDDTYNASPASSLAALETLGEIKASRKIAVLGDMLELGADTEEGHKRVARKFLDIKGNIFLGVGSRMFLAREELNKNNFNSGSFLHFKNSLEAGKALQKIIKKGDLVLIKGSQAMRMEKITEEIMRDPLLAGKLLCRQSRTWKNTPVRDL